MPQPMTAVIRDLGRMAYRPCWDLQVEVQNDVIAGGPDTLIFVEHDPVLTLGASFQKEHLLLSSVQFQELGIDVVETDRGGDVTFHGPGQLVIYPIFDIKRHGQDLHRWMRDLEETMILSLAALSLAGRRFPPHTGAWIGDQKVAAIGIKVRKWVSLHGIALNCDNDLSPFETIVPCGIEGYGVTSLSEATGRAVTTAEVKPIVLDSFARVFGLEF